MDIEPEIKEDKMDEENNEVKYEVKEENNMNAEEDGAGEKKFVE